MPVDLHLFSTPGKNGIEYIVEASRLYLEGKDQPTIAYIPFASLYNEQYLELTEESFGGLAQIKAINAELMQQKEIEAIIRDASLVYVPGGNTFLLNHRLHLCGIVPYLKKKVQAGLPVIGFSAGAILCGPNILTSNDLNTVGTLYFDGLNAIPFNILPHYPLDAAGQSVKDAWLADYHFFHDNPIIMMTDDAYILVEGRKSTLVHGEAWIWHRDQEKEQLKEGKAIKL